MATLFSKQASTYALGRAIYSKSFFSYLASLTASHSRAWDVGTGNGQAALLLADHYEAVIATDASETQIYHALPHPNVTFAVTPPAMSREDLRAFIGEDGTVDLVVCAQSLHWFDLDTFYPHVKTILRKPGGVIAAWAYQNPSVSPSVDAVLSRFTESIATEWAPEIRYILEGYKTIPFPFQPVESLGSTGPFLFECAKEATLEAYLAHLRSWSAVQKAIDSGRDVWSEEQQARFKDAWGDAPTRTVKWTLHTLIGTNS